MHFVAAFEVIVDEEELTSADVTVSKIVSLSRDRSAIHPD